MYYTSRIVYRPVTFRGLYHTYRSVFNPVMSAMLALIGRMMNEETQVEVFEFRGKPRVNEHQLWKTL